MDLQGDIMEYPLPESIGNPDLFVGREEEFEYLNEWLGNIQSDCQYLQLFSPGEKVVKLLF